jgi:hypothetical protein
VKIGQKYWIAALCISTALAFFGQMMFCFDDRAGIVTWCDSNHSEHRHDTSPSDSSSQANCCLTHSGSALIITGLARLPIQFSVVGIAFQTDDSAPEGWVHKIDHPPQLS